MDFNKEIDFIREITEGNLSYDSQIAILFEILENILDKGAIRARTVKYKLSRYMKSTSALEKAYALVRIASDGKGTDVLPKDPNRVEDLIKESVDWIADEIARRYIKSNIEAQVEKSIIEKQEKYVDEVRLSILKKQKGSENKKTRKKYKDLLDLDTRVTSKNIMTLLRPQNFDEVVGQERAIKSLISKLSSPYPQHIILYGPPGVGKTTAARIALEKVRELSYTPFDDKSKFVEVDGTTLRCDPREITNPLLGSVHDPIYQGSKRDLAEIGVPEPKPGLVTEAHGGILFIDEIGELDNILQNKLLKVLEDKRVEFSSSYYDPDDENIPAYIKYLFDNGAPADFVLIGATTKEPGDINPALRSRCTEVYFEPLSAMDIQKIVENAAKKLEVKIEDGVAEYISRYTVEGRKAVNILTDAYGYSLYSKKRTRIKGFTIKLSDVEEVIAIGRYSPFEIFDNDSKYEVGHIYGLGVSGFLGSTIEIEATTFKAKKPGAGTIRFNETAGSMAKDSVYNATSVIRKHTNKDIKDYDIHVNVIGGGKIDGPSAGAAITACIISSLTDNPIRQDIAVTGEISLRGKIKPVGGIFEKVYGARRKGIKQVFVPIDNKKDIPQGLTDIKVDAIGEMEELLKNIFKN